MPTQLRDHDGPPLPEPIAAFFAAVNAGNLDAIVESFAERAMVNDELQEYWDRSAIADWVRRQIVGQQLSVEVHRVVRNGEHTVVAAKVDGSFDRRGLPEPLILTFYCSSNEGKLVQLLILRNEPVLSATP